MVTLTDSAILKKIEQQPKRSAGFKQLARELGLRGDGRRELTERLERLVAEGQLVQLDSDRYAMPKATGRNTLHWTAEPASRWLWFRDSGSFFPG